MLEALPGFANFRPVGSRELQLGRRLIVYRSNTPEIAPDVVPHEASQFFDRIVDLRTDEEIAEFPHPFASSSGYRHRPLLDPTSEAVESVTMLDLLAVYCDWSTRHRRTLRAIFEEIAATPGGTVLIGCAAGKDRTGVVSALSARLRGADEQVLGEDYAETADRMADRFAQELLAATDPAFTRQMQRCDPPVIVAFIRHIERTHGSVAAYLRWLGLTDTAIDALIQ